MPSHPSRYDESDYGREPARGIRRERDGRDVRERETVREVRPSERSTRMEVEPQRVPRMVEPEIMRTEQQRMANSGVPRQNDPTRAVRNVPPRDRDEDMIYDTRANQYPQIRDPPARTIPYEGEFDDMPPSVRPVIDPGRSRDEPRPNYNEYFLPGEGIDREVIQSEICRYLGQDATCKPGTHSDGRRGYIIRAYRALTTEMIRSLKEDSAKYARERENAARKNRQPVSFATIRDATRYGGDEMMIDEPEDRYPARYDDLRARPPPVTSVYPPDAGYPAYSYPAVNQPPPPGIDTRNMDPRYIPSNVPGNTTPPTRNLGYATGGYPPVTTRPTTTTVPPGAAYRDPRANIVRDPGYGYPADSRRGHR